MAVAVEDGIISDVTSNGVRGPFDEVHDFSQHVIMPGLIDTHVHLQLTPGPDHESGIQTYLEDSIAGVLPLRALRHAQEALGVGITTVRDCGGDMSILLVRDAIQRGHPGPRILAAGHPITTTGGHGHWFGLRADDVSEIRKATRKLIEGGVDFIKIMASGGNMTAGSNPCQPQYSGQELSVAVREAHRLGRRVVAHALSVETIRNCVEAGVDSIDHCTWQLPDTSLSYDSALADQLIAAGSRVGITGSGILRMLLEQGDTGAAKLRTALDAHRQLYMSGASVTVHSDAGVRFTPITRFDQSMKVMMVGLGLSPKEVLRAVTAVAAEAIGLQDELGTVEVGRRADLLVLDANPLDELENITSVRAVFRDGRQLIEGGRMVLVHPED